MKKVLMTEILEYLSKEKVEYEFLGNREVEIDGFSSVSNYRKNSITWIKSKEKYLELSKKVDWKTINHLVADYETQDIAQFEDVIICDNPKHIFYSILNEFFTEAKAEFIGRGTFISESAEVGKNVFIGTNCFIGDSVRIGEGSRIYHNVVVNHNTEIGKDCRIKSGTVIGEEGYGYSEDKGEFYHVPHFGRVIIEDCVEIGANTCIDQGTLGDTIIGKGTKIDNLCHIAHNVQIGRNVRIVAGCVVAGSTTIEDNSYIAPGAIIRNQLSVGSGSIIGMGSVLTQNADSEMVYAGVPGKVIRKVGKENL